MLAVWNPILKVNFLFKPSIQIIFILYNIEGIKILFFLDCQFILYINDCLNYKKKNYQTIQCKRQRYIASFYRDFVLYKESYDGNLNIPTESKFQDLLL